MVLCHCQSCRVWHHCGVNGAKAACANMSWRHSVTRMEYRLTCVMNLEITITDEL